MGGVQDRVWLCVTKQNYPCTVHRLSVNNILSLSQMKTYTCWGLSVTSGRHWHPLIGGAFTYKDMWLISVKIWEMLTGGSISMSRLSIQEVCHEMMNSYKWTDSGCLTINFIICVAIHQPLNIAFAAKEVHTVSTTKILIQQSWYECMWKLCS